MAFALLSRSRSKPQGSVKPVPKWKSARGQHSADSRFGFVKPVFQPQTAALPMMPVLQSKLKIGEPNDKFEQEADRVADEVMRMPDSAIAVAASASSGTSDSDKPARNIPLSIQRLCAECVAEEEEKLQRKPLSIVPVPPRISPLNGPLVARFEFPIQPARIQRQEMEEKEEEVLQMKRSWTTLQTQEVSPSLEARLDSIRGSGQLLPPSIRAFFEPRFGYDLSRVLIHTDAQAAASARAVDARAYTVGQHIVFDAGKYAPTTSEGKRLLAHELTHTIQQHNHRSLGNGTLSSLSINRHGEHDKQGGERTFTAITQIGESQQPSTHHDTRVRLDHPLAVQRVCKGSARTRNAIVSNKEDDYKQAVKAGTYCRDTGSTGFLHSGTCYREVPTRSGYFECPPGDQVCFDEGVCDDSPDKVSPVQKQERDGSCNLHGFCAAYHGVREVEPVQGAILGALTPVGLLPGAFIGWLLGRE